MLRPCPVCGNHARAEASTCPCCASALPRGVPTATAALLALTMAGCPLGEEDTAKETGDTAIMELYGVAYVDDDKDGYNSYEDCDDHDAAVHPDAKETAGDGVDSNCNGDDDT